MYFLNLSIWGLLKINIFKSSSLPAGLLQQNFYLQCSLFVIVNSFIGLGYRARKMSPFWWPLKLWKKIVFFLGGMMASFSSQSLLPHMAFSGQKKLWSTNSSCGDGVTCPRKHFWALLLCRPCGTAGAIHLQLWGPLLSCPPFLNHFSLRVA